MKEILIQLIGILAWIFLFSSYRAKNIKKIILIQLCSSSLNVTHYYLLGAYTAFQDFSILLFTKLYPLIEYIYNNLLKNEGYEKVEQSLTLQIKIIRIIDKNYNYKIIKRSW